MEVFNVRYRLGSMSNRPLDVMRRFIRFTIRAHLASCNYHNLSIIFPLISDTAIYSLVQNSECDKNAEIWKFHLQLFWKVYIPMVRLNIFIGDSDLVIIITWKLLDVWACCLLLHRNVALIAKISEVGNLDLFRRSKFNFACLIVPPVYLET